MERRDIPKQLSAASPEAHCGKPRCPKRTVRPKLSAPYFKSASAAIVGFGSTPRTHAARSFHLTYAPASVSSFRREPQEGRWAIGQIVGGYSRRTRPPFGALAHQRAGPPTAWPVNWKWTTRELQGWPSHLGLSIRAYPNTSLRHWHMACNLRIVLPQIARRCVDGRWIRVKVSPDPRGLVGTDRFGDPDLQIQL